MTHNNYSKYRKLSENVSNFKCSIINIFKKHKNNKCVNTK